MTLNEINANTVFDRAAVERAYQRLLSVAHCTYLPVRLQEDLLILIACAIAWESYLKASGR